MADTEPQATMRAKILIRARNVLSNIEQLFADVDHINANFLQAEPVNIDADGTLAAARTRIREMVAAEDAKRPTTETRV